jgi:hypothetical protein
MQSRIIIIVIIFLSLFIPSCGGFEFGGGEYSFSDTATFYAPKSKVKIVVFSKGHVPNGEDLGDGRGLAELTFTEHYNDTLRLSTSPENIDIIVYKDKRISFHCDQMNKIALYNFLDSAGYKHLDKNEISELRDAMTFINYGHKVGFADGQTKYIQIKELKKHSFD